MPSAYDVPNGSILKIDCEGCEYDSILHTPDIALQRFSHIQIEYHLGYRDLKEKLEKYGAEKLKDWELLAILLRTGTKEIDVVKLSQKILRDFPGEKILDSRYFSFVLNIASYICILS